MQIIPVLDLLNSVVVRGVAGRRDEYRPIQSSLTASAEPLAIATAIREHFGLSTFYVADLDAILREQPSFEIYEQLHQEGFRLLIDAGIRTGWDAEAVLAAGASQVIIGTESWPLLSSLEMLTHRLGPERLIVSLDLKNGSLIRCFPDLMSDDPLEVGCAILEAGVRELIVLDLAAVGVGNGVPTLPLCRDLRDIQPQVKLITGGGVRSVNDLLSLQSEGIDGALVASALHDGRLIRADIKQLMTPTD